MYTYWDILQNEFLLDPCPTAPQRVLEIDYAVFVTKEHKQLKSKSWDPHNLLGGEMRLECASKSEEHVAK